MELEVLSASGRGSEKLSLPALQSKMKCDPEGYVTELELIYGQFKSSLYIFQQQASMNFTSLTGIKTDPAISKNLADRVMFLAHVTPFFPKHLSQFPKELASFLQSSAPTLPSSLRCTVTKALIQLINRNMVDLGENLPLFMELQTLGDTVLRKLASTHIVRRIKKMNQKHKNDVKNRALQNIIFNMLQQEDELKAKRSLIILCELHKRKVWFDDRTANAICLACFHPSSRIMIAALSFLLDYEKIQYDEDDDDSDADSEDELAAKKNEVVLSREALYKAFHKGTVSSKKKKKAKLLRVKRSLKKQQRKSTDDGKPDFYSPLYHLKDAQGFVEKFFSRLQACTERFEVKMMMLKLIARTIGLHSLILLNFYPFLQKYVQPHQRDVTNLLAAAVQACHDMVPPDAVEPLFKQLVNQFVHDKSRTEAITVGLNVVREICIRIPLLMTEELLQDLVLYKKSNEKSVSSAARSLISLFREICPSLLIKKDRGRPNDLKARPKEFGEAHSSSNVHGIEFLQGQDNSDNDEDENPLDLDEEEDDVEAEDDDFDSISDDEEADEDECEADSDESMEDCSDEDMDDCEERSNASEPKSRKRKLSDFDGQLDVAESSLRALKRLAREETKVGLPNTTEEIADGILSNEDFKRIKELKAKNEAKTLFKQHGLLKDDFDGKSTSNGPNFDNLSTRRVDPGKLEAGIRRKQTKDERLASIREGREDRTKYQSRTATKQKKVGGSSNRQKEHKKKMPLAAKRSKIVKSRQEKKKKQKRASTQFRGRKAWKS
ncbi:protein SDA1 homolog [Impatiens glandulifera]|uniref:protein SDA1 homolog n=1 Tax=Impatiens glandulifera TaxID=253017 RepID=UPI001FB0BBD4|nr:protein SDA1 homolog [Impatiens glandulifera]XP_047330810.1 protein SDA1 homolog [Impatiens glandulifera]